MPINKNDYIGLGLTAAAYLAFVLYFPTRPDYVLVATASFAVVYIGWGVIHHLRSGSLRARIVLEYLLVALLGVIIVATLLV